MRAKFTGATWPGTGRVVDVHMYGLTQREIAGQLTGEPFLSRLAQADIDVFAMPPDPPDLLGYIELALRGGFPDAALELSPTREAHGWAAIWTSSSPETPRPCTRIATRTA